MNFSFSSDQQLLKTSARAFLDEHMKPATVRLLWDDPRGESEALWKEMGELGWLGLSLPEAHGGSGLGMVETAILLEEMGHAALPGPYLPTVLAARAIEEAGTNAQRTRWLSAIATGEARATLAFLDADLDWRPEGTRTRAEKSATGWTLSGTKRFVPWAHVADVLLVPARPPGGLTLFLVDPAAAGLTVEPTQVMDGTTRLVTVTLDATPVGGDAVLGAPGQADALLAGLLRRGAVGAAAEMLGAARRCLDMAVGYAKVREQFGQPIGSFQAIRHKCAEMLLEVENSHAAVYYSAWALDARAEDAELAASVAKAYVGDAARRVCGEAIQVHGGIGFTWEYDLHLYFKRAKALDQRGPQDPGGPGDRRAARHGRRRVHGEHAARCRRAPWRRLDAVRRAQPAPRLLLGHRVRLHRPRRGASGLRSDLPGARRPHDAPGLRRAAPVPPHGADRLLHGRAGDPGHPRGALHARAHRAGPARRDLAPAGRAGAPVGCRRRLRGQALAGPRQPDLPPLPGGRRPVVLPRGRQPVLLGQAHEGARPRARRRRSALRLLAPARPEQRGPPADPRGAVPREAPHRVARAPGRPRHPGGARAATARLLRGPGGTPPRPGVRVRASRGRPPPPGGAAHHLHRDADAGSGPATHARPAHRRDPVRARLHGRRDRGAPRAPRAGRPAPMTYETILYDAADGVATVP